MNTYIVTHELRNGVTQDMAIPSAKRLIASLPDGVKWVMTWYLPEDNTMLCLWEAPSSETVVAAITEGDTDEILPISQVREAVVLSPDWFAQAE